MTISLNIAERNAGRKLTGVANKVSCKIIRMPVTYAQLSINDIISTGVIIPAGSRITEVVVRNGTGTASSTISIGLRLAAPPFTVVSATALAATHAITTASGGAKVVSGALLAAGASSVVAADSEVYITALGAALAANQALEVAVSYLAP